MKVFAPFLCMSLCYTDFSTVETLGFPTSSRCSIMNNCELRIEYRKPGTDEVERRETYKVNDFEVVKLFDDIQKILREDVFNSTPAKLEGPLSVDFEIVYSMSGHREQCSPLLANKNGVTILSIIEGFVLFAKKEHRYYNWCSVAFSEFGDGYSYFCDDDNVEVGDKVLVPVGKDNKEKTGTVINTWRLAEEHLPYPAEKTKKIIKVLREEKEEQPSL